MDAGIAASIQSRLDAIVNYYDICGEVEKKVNDLFERMRQFGMTCNDQADFEIRFGESPLYGEYMNLFSELAAYIKPAEGAPTLQQQTDEVLLHNASSAVKQNINSAIKGAVVNAVPNEVSDWMIYRENNIPIYAELKQAKQTAEMLGIRNPFSKKNDEEE
ncbi:hypothetical protein LJC55_03990 [Eubacteriales bacterium OttesenSCG-928-N14]|nr:hypothetical protein [Eubacteriales bacterium OttesenSCG-928-N14]